MRLPGLRQATAALVVATLLAGCGSDPEDSSPDAGTTPASSPVSSEDLEPVADWLAGEVDRQGFVEGEYIDHGLSLDYATALERIGGHDDVVERILDAMQDPEEVSGYVSFYDEAKNGQYAGATAKLIDTVVAAGRDPSDYRGDLVTDLEAMVVESGAEAGRAKDTGETDYSNTISQSYVVRALTATGSEGSVEPTVEFLLAQQCEDGGFREPMTAGPDGDHSCEGGPQGERAPSVDATAHAVQSLLAVTDELEGELAETAEQATSRAVDWLVSVQGDDGGWTVDGGAGQPNANSTGLATAALDAAGREEPAYRGAEWLLGHVVPADADEGLAGETGAVAFDTRTLTQAQAGGIKPDDRYIWQRATVEAALGMQSVTEE